METDAAVEKQERFFHRSLQNACWRFAQFLCAADHKNWYVQRDVMCSAKAEIAQDGFFVRPPRT